MSARASRTGGRERRGVRATAPRSRLPPAPPRPRSRRRALAVLALAAIAFAIGVIAGAGHGRSGAALAADFARAWARDDYATMYHDVDAQTQARLGVLALAAAYRHDEDTATVRGRAVLGRPRAIAGGFAIPVLVRTRVFGDLRLSLTLPIATSAGHTAVTWSRALLFPGLAAGEQLTRRSVMPQRAPLLARDGSVLASGPALAGQRASALGVAALSVVGELGPVPADRAQALDALGVPANAIVGVSGLELALDDELIGHPGGELLAGSRVLASVLPRPSPPVHTTISPAMQQAAVAALGGQLGGVVALKPQGDVLAVAGLGVNDLQPPGSTFKMITVTGALQYHLATPTTVFPYGTAATLDGVLLRNANGEDCGGTLANAFAVSCNSVFAPLGARLGASRLLALAQRFGFNQPTGIPGVVESTISPSSLTDDLAVGSSAIGQDTVDASPLQMALVAATIANGGRRPGPTFLLGHHSRAVRVTSSAVARTVRRLMELVVQQGTGTAAAIPGVTVAGKTGTAELTNTVTCQPRQTQSCSSQNNPQNTDAWFAAFAPAVHPRIVVSVLLVRDGAGGATAAPAAQGVLEAGLRSA